MKIYIQSKSGNYNGMEAFVFTNLEECLYAIRKRGGYYTKYRDTTVFVPFEEIEHIGEKK